MSQKAQKNAKDVIIECLKLYTKEEINPNEPLISSGIIQSIDMLEIMLTLEEHGFDNAHIDLPNVDSVNDILRMIKDNT